MMRQPKISIITPNFNYGMFLPKLIESVQSQNYTNFEHIIVDDGSTDNSVEVLEHYQKIYANTLTVKCQSNKGQTVALNEALRLANGDIIAWINSDDFYYPNSFSIIASEFCKDYSVDAVFGDIMVVDQSGNPIRMIRYLDFDYNSGIFNSFGNLLSSNSIFWKRELSLKIGLFDEEFIFAMDAEYWSRLLYKAKIRHIDIIIAAFRHHLGAKTTKRKTIISEAGKRALFESSLIRKQAYNQTNFPKYLDIKQSFLIGIYYKIKRFVLRFLKGHYFEK